MGGNPAQIANDVESTLNLENISTFISINGLQLKAKMSQGACRSVT